MNVLITGCTRGIGLDTALRLDKLGHRVFATVKNQVSLKEQKNNLRGIKNNLFCSILDITQDNDMLKSLSFDIDVLIHNAALGDSGPLCDIDIDRIKNTIDVNIISVIKLSQLLIPHLAKKENSRIIFISSLAALIPMPYMSPYALTKSAIESIAFSLKEELKPFKIQVTIVNPGGYNTGFNQKMIKKKYAWIKDSVLYKNHLELIKKHESKLLKMEHKKTKSIAEEIVKAATCRKVKKRYAAPFYQYLAAKMIRLIKM